MPTALPPFVVESLPWNRLLRDIHNRQVLPIIGPGLVTVDQNGLAIPFTDWLAPDFACRLGLVPEEGMSLNRVACAHLVNRGKRKDIYEELRELVEQHEKLPVPQGLADLAAIRDFDLFITSTFDGFLTKALRQARPGWKPDDRGLAAFHPNKPVDLPDTLPGTFAYHVLGAWNTYPDFAVWEEDYMEFLCGLLEAPKDTQKNLLRVLKNRSLLLIGAPFGDWIVRFFLRVAKQGRLSELKDTADYLADRSDLLGEPMVFYFDKVIGSPRIISTEPAAFAAELRRRWAEKYEASSMDDLLASIPDDMERGSVFISYSHDDLAAAAALASGLKAAGIPVWLDRRRLNPGGDWELALKRAVKSRASLFLSLISVATEQGNPDRFVHRERIWAAEVHVPGEIFYLPIFIDATTTTAREPEVFAPLHRHSMPGGMVTPDFATLLRRYLDQYHQDGEVRDV